MNKDRINLQSIQAVRKSALEELEDATKNNLHALAAEMQSHDLQWLVSQLPQEKAKVLLEASQGMLTKLDPKLRDDFERYQRTREILKTIRKKDDSDE